MKVSDIGECQLIDRLNILLHQKPDENTPARENLILDIGDDAAVFLPQGYQLVTVDSLIENVHFNRSMLNWADLGYKALAINMSDIAAMGGLPQYAVVNIDLPPDTLVSSVTDCYNAMYSLANKYQTVIIAGDTNQSSIINLAITLLGSAENPSCLLTRNAAQAGQKIAVTGYLGNAAAGLDMLLNQTEVTDESRRIFYRSFYRPEPRINEARLLVNEGVHCCIDVSDGLVTDLGHILRQSRVSARIELDKLPLHPSLRLSYPLQAQNMALYGGEDYELLFTASAKVIEQISVQSHIPVTIIGEIIPGKPEKLKLVDKDGRALQPEKNGWEHFKKPK
ncbi:thiamine-monophosphate kinase [Dehalococcoides mccartyi]|uniref:thiamine-phosphate kinase n=1 Tax=Dehalococcoides mccartyi TaxID=61435 RepID=UPI0002B768B3|nr:thiamine-phosphate kinase [Dehalococcoides mccartyi]AGG07470.1 thiamine-monophosphate kinase [Dehalococcoides mccartyi BTF08]KSV16674.1 thiamine-monophosphate kinase [Dehalococcoides mccartyi]